MLDLDQFIQLYAMEFLLKHWDGYASNTNNTYLYNDLKAVAKPGPEGRPVQDDPVGVFDQILKPWVPFKMGKGRAGREAGARGRRTARAADRPDQDLPRHGRRPRDPADDAEADDRSGWKRCSPVSECRTPRRRSRRSASTCGWPNRRPLLCAGVPGGRPPGPRPQAGHLRVPARQQPRGSAGCHAAPSTSRSTGAHPCPHADDPTDLWTLADLGTGKSATSQAFGRALHASDTLVTREQSSSYRRPVEQRRPRRGVL